MVFTYVCVYLWIVYNYVCHVAVKKLLVDVDVQKEDGKVHVHLGTSPNVSLDKRMWIG